MIDKIPPMKKLHVFIITVVIGIVTTMKPAIESGFSEESLHKWFLNALLVAAILGFAATRFLKARGKLR